MRIARSRAGAAAVAGVMLLAGCSGATGPRTSTGVPRQLTQRELAAVAAKAPCGMVKTAQNLADHRVVAAFAVAAVVECEYDNLEIPGQGTWSVLVRQVSGSGLPRLKAVLSQPDTHRPSPPDTGCALVGYLPLRILLTDGAGHYLHPHTPSDACGAPLRNVFPTVNRIVWRTVSITRFSRAQADPPSMNACEWDTRSAVQQAHSTVASSGDLVLDPDPGGLVACSYYSLDDAGDGRSSRLMRLPIARSELTQLLGGPPPAPGRVCPAQNRFAVLHDRHHHALAVELGGCWRVARLAPSPAIIGTAPPSFLRRMLLDS